MFSLLVCKQIGDVLTDCTHNCNARDYLEHNITGKRVRQRNCRVLRGFSWFNVTRSVIRTIKAHSRYKEQQRQGTDHQNTLEYI
jgi:predicted methyltransferase